MSLASQSFFKYVCCTLTHAAFDQPTQSFEPRRDFTDPDIKCREQQTENLCFIPRWGQCWSVRLQCANVREALGDLPSEWHRWQQHKSGNSRSMTAVAAPPVFSIVSEVTTVLHRCCLWHHRAESKDTGMLPAANLSYTPFTHWGRGKVNRLQIRRETISLRASSFGLQGKGSAAPDSYRTAFTYTCILHRPLPRPPFTIPLQHNSYASNTGNHTKGTYLLWVSSINAVLSGDGSGQRRCRSSAPSQHAASSSHITDAASFLLSLLHRQLHPHLLLLLLLNLLLQRPPFYPPLAISMVTDLNPLQCSRLSRAAAAAERLFVSALNHR